MLSNDSTRSIWNGTGHQSHICIRVLWSGLTDCMSSYPECMGCCLLCQPLAYLAQTWFMYRLPWYSLNITEWIWSLKRPQWHQYGTWPVSPIWCLTQRDQYGAWPVSPIWNLTSFTDMVPDTVSPIWCLTQCHWYGAWHSFTNFVPDTVSPICCLTQCYWYGAWPVSPTRHLARCRQYATKMVSDLVLLILRLALWYKCTNQV